MGEVNVSRELEGRDSCVCQESCVVAIYMEDSYKGQIGGRNKDSIIEDPRNCPGRVHT